MPVREPEKSLATKNSNSFELYENRKAYKNKTLTIFCCGIFISLLFLHISLNYIYKTI